MEEARIKGKSGSELPTIEWTLDTGLRVIGKVNGFTQDPAKARADFETYQGSVFAAHVEMLQATLDKGARLQGLTNERALTAPAPRPDGTPEIVPTDAAREAARLVWAALAAPRT